MLEIAITSAGGTERELGARPPTITRSVGACPRMDDSRQWFFSLPILMLSPSHIFLHIGLLIDHAFPWLLDRASMCRFLSAAALAFSYDLCTMNG